MNPREDEELRIACFRSEVSVLCVRWICGIR
jgi:hypothetical protein